MSKYQVTLNLHFDVTVPVFADNDTEAGEKAEDMDLAEILEWSGCASYDAHIVNVTEDD
jgi:hypothetical protein